MGRSADRALRSSSSESADAKIVPVKKTLRFDSADFPSVAGKTEGMALLADGALALINDDDFGIGGARTQIVVVRGLTSAIAMIRAIRRENVMKSYRIAAIPGDGIGNEVVPEGIRVLEAAGKRFGLSFSFDHFDWSCEHYAKHGRMMPEGGLDQIRKHDAIFLGAVGFPGVPDHVSLWGLLIPIRREFQQYVNLRPCRCCAA